MIDTVDSQAPALLLWLLEKRTENPNLVHTVNEFLGVDDPDSDAAVPVADY